MLHWQNKIHIEFYKKLLSIRYNRIGNDLSRKFIKLSDKIDNEHFWFRISDDNMPKGFSDAMYKIICNVEKLEDVRIPFSLKVAQYWINDESILQNIKKEFKLNDDFKISNKDMDTVIKYEGKDDLKDKLIDFFMRVQKELQNSVNRKVNKYYMRKALSIGLRAIIITAGIVGSFKFGSLAIFAWGGALTLLDEIEDKWFNLKSFL